MHIVRQIIQVSDDWLVLQHPDVFIWPHTVPPSWVGWEESPWHNLPPAGWQTELHSSSQTPEQDLCFLTEHINIKYIHSGASLKKKFGQDNFKMQPVKLVCDSFNCIIFLSVCIYCFSLLYWNSAAAEARVAWPHRSISVVGVNHRRRNLDPVNHISRWSLYHI